MAKLHVLDHTGDTVIELSATDTEGAVAAFERHLASGGAIIRTKPGPEEVVRDFDPTAEEYIAIPQIQGG